MKYIDAEKLKRFVGELKKTANRNCCDSWGIVPKALEEVEDFIASLQQEQPEPTCKSCGFYENNCPFIRNTFKPYPNRVCKDYTYSVMKKQEQPEVDLEKEIKRFLSNATKMNKGEWRGKYPISDIGFRAVARHFAEWGAIHLNARKEEL